MDAGRRNLLVVSASNFAASAGMACFLPAFPIILHRLGIDEPSEVEIWTGVLTAAAPFSAALAGPFWGALGDRIGRKLMVLRALLGIVVFVGAMAFVTSPFVLLALRLGQGLFSGFIAPSLTFVSVHTPQERQGRVAAQLQVALLAGAVVGPPLGGFLLDEGSPAMLFAVASLGSLLAALLVAALSEEEVRPAPRADAAGPLASVVGMLSDLRRTVGDPRVARVLLVVFAVRFGISSVEPLFATYVKEFEETSALVRENLGFANGALVSAVALGNLVALHAWGRRGDLHGHRNALVLATAGAALLYAPQAFATDPTMLFALRFLAGLFLAGTIPAAYGLVAEETPNERRGSSFSLTFSAIALANSVAPVAGGLLAGPLGIRTLIGFSAAPMLAAALWMTTWPKKSRAS